MDNTEQLLDEEEKSYSPDISDMSDIDVSNISDSTDNIESSDTSDYSDNTHHSKHSFSILQFILNCFLHVTILFFFLFNLFIILIGPAAQKGFKHEFHNIIGELFDHAIPKPLNFDTMTDEDLDNLLSFYTVYNSLDPVSKATLRINIRQLYTLLKNNPYIIKNYLREYSIPNFLISQHNDDVLAYGNAIILFLIIITLLLCGIFKYYYPTHINLSKLFIENIITFIFIGIGEYWFFTAYAAKFIPAPPSLISKSAIDTIKERFIQ
jgi:hypothetical protein